MWSSPGSGSRPWPSRPDEMEEKPSPFARAVVDATPLLAGGLIVSPLLLFIPSSWDLTFRLIAHLSLLVALGIATAVMLAPRLGEPFFGGFAWTPWRRTLAAAAVLVVIPTGVVALVTLASSAALRFDPSLQFLQLLSALDIAWAAAAIVVGAHHRWGRTASVGSGVALGVACVLSIWNYVRVVGFSDSGGWVVDGTRLMTLVIPFDMVAAAVATAVLLVGVGAVSANGAGQGPVV